MQANQILLGDCLELMQQLPDQSVDMILADLPYGVTACKWDKIIDLEQLWAQFKRLIKPKSAIVLTATQPFTTDLINSNRKWFKYEWIWEKNYGTNFASVKYQPMKQHENVLVFGEKSVLYNAQKIKRNKAGISRAKYASNPSNTGKRQFMGGLNETLVRPARDNEMRCPSSVLKVNMQVGLHPTQKPTALFEYLIKTYTNEGAIVFDPTIGSGTTAIAALNTNRQFIGIEKDAAYHQIACDRIAQHSKQLSIAS